MSHTPHYNADGTLNIGKVYTTNTVLVSNGSTLGWSGIQPSGEIKVSNEKRSTLYVYDLRVVDLREDVDRPIGFNKRVLLTLLEEEIVVGPGQDVRTQILLKNATKINDIDPGHECTIDIHYTKTYQFVSEKD